MALSRAVRPCNGGQVAGAPRRWLHGGWDDKLVRRVGWRWECVDGERCGEGRPSKQPASAALRAARTSVPGGGEEPGAQLATPNRRRIQARARRERRRSGGRRAGLVTVRIHRVPSSAQRRPGCPRSLPQGLRRRMSPALPQFVRRRVTKHTSAVYDSRAWKWGGVAAVAKTGVHETFSLLERAARRPYSFPKPSSRRCHSRAVWLAACRAHSSAGCAAPAACSATNPSSGPGHALTFLCRACSEVMVMDTARRHCLTAAPARSAEQGVAAKRNSHRPWEQHSPSSSAARCQRRRSSFVARLGAGAAWRLGGAKSNGGAQRVPVGFVRREAASP